MTLQWKILSDAILCIRCNCNTWVGLAVTDTHHLAYRPAGTRSSRETDPTEAQAIWSMAFERHDAADLRVKHAKLVDLVYGEEGFY